jgi:hypothetical protein
MENNILIENQYFGCVNWCIDLFNSSNVVIEQWENFQKMSFRNRSIISGSNGTINLTIPLEGGRNQKLPIKEVKISKYENWQQQHWKSILSCYGNAPFFEYYKNDVEKLVKSQHQFLFDFNWEILQWIKKVVSITAIITCSENFKTDYSDNNILDLRSKWTPKNFQENDNVVKYYQVFEERNGFKNNLSILDILFNEGPNTKNILKGSNHKY